MTSDAGSIGTIPTFAASEGSRKRLRLINRVSSVVLVEHEAPDPVAVFGTGREHAAGLDAFEAHAVRAVAERVADLRMLVLGQDAVRAVHVQAEQVLDPVVGVGAAARRRTDLRDPGPDR